MLMAILGSGNENLNALKKQQVIVYKLLFLPYKGIGSCFYLSVQK